MNVIFKSAAKLQHFRDMCKKKVQIFAYVKKKQYICTRNCKGGIRK